jgi:hypothetical protein
MKKEIEQFLVPNTHVGVCGPELNNVVHHIHAADVLDEI